MSDSQPQPRTSITESPWYWVYLFCTAGLIALLLMGPRYAARQAQIEHKSQARQQAARLVGGEPAEPAAASAGPAIPLWPLYLLLAVVLAVAWIALWRRRWRRPDAHPTSAA